MKRKCQTTGKRGGWIYVSNPWGMSLIAVSFGLIHEKKRSFPGVWSGHDRIDHKKCKALWHCAFRCFALMCQNEYYIKLNSCSWKKLIRGKSSLAETHWQDVRTKRTCTLENNVEENLHECNPVCCIFTNSHPLLIIQTRWRALLFIHYISKAPTLQHITVKCNPWHHYYLKYPTPEL